MKYLITGGAGFIGSNLARYILDKGHEVTVLDNFSTGKWQNLTDILDKITLIKGDVRDRETVDAAVEGVSAVFHEAAIGSVPRSVKEPNFAHSNNVNGTVNVLEAVRAAGIKRLVFAASSSAYGDQLVSPKVETMNPMPISPYAANKVACEMYMQAYHAAYGLETVCLRYFNVFGPRQDPFGAYAAVIPAFVSNILQNKRPQVFGDGEQTRDFCYIENVCSANWLAAHAPAENCTGRAVNIACRSAVSLNQILNKIKSLMHSEIEAEYLPERVGDIKHSLADIAAAKQMIGYEPLVYFDEGLERAISWYTENL
ncbi:MAG: SDR family oxidoreductase [Planctomycetaceae bacterium]|jgi:UDP-glucose 4-epimerase|nr:SDR family oxidoreductase [Planctomycetaceae bacterium]